MYAVLVMQKEKGKKLYFAATRRPHYRHIAFFFKSYCLHQHLLHLLARSIFPLWATPQIILSHLVSACSRHLTIVSIVYMLYSSTRWFSNVLTFYTFTAHRMETSLLLYANTLPPPPPPPPSQLPVLFSRHMCAWMHEWTEKLFQWMKSLRLIK